MDACEMDIHTDGCRGLSLSVLTERGNLAVFSFDNTSPKERDHGFQPKRRTENGSANRT